MGLFSRFIGKAGEDKAVLYLKKKHYRILERNYRTRYGEIDIIAQIGNVTVFVEVKQRKDEQFGRPEDWVTPQKKNRIISAAKRYLFEKENYNDYFRFDVIAITANEIIHMENAFEADSKI